MNLTKENKKEIDEKSYEELLYEWRFSPAGNPWFEGRTGKYWIRRMMILIDQGADHVAISKKIGWIIISEQIYFFLLSGLP